MNFQLWQPGRRVIPIRKAFSSSATRLNGNRVFIRAIHASVKLFGILSLIICVSSAAFALGLDGTSGVNVIATDHDTSGNLNLTLDFRVEYLVVGGGGGGGAGSAISAGGGGGAGEYKSDLTGNLTISSTDYSVVVGAGGSGGNATSVAGSNGNSSSFSSITSFGGGGGGSLTNNGTGSVLGGGGSSSGIGGAGSTQPGGSGYIRTTGGSTKYGGGGGAGFGGNGSNASNGNANGGAGGAGVSNTISGAAVDYAGGGGGGSSSAAGAGGLGGGGAGSSAGGAAAGSANTGGGGGGAFNGDGGAGGSGVVVVRYQGAQAAGNNGTITSISDNSTSYTVHSFTSVGSDTLSFSSLDLNARLGATVTGNITGSGSLTFNGPGRLTLNGTNTYTGATTVAAGKLVVNSSIASSSLVTVESGAGLAGSGTVSSLSLAAGATLSPGNSPGTLNVTGNASWNGGANYEWQLYNAAGSAGTGWDLLDVSNSLNLVGLSSTKFNLKLQTLSAINPDVSGTPLNYNPSTTSFWMIASAAGGLLIDGTAASANTDYTSLFSIDSNNWSGGLPSGGFQVVTLGNAQDLYLKAVGGISAVPEPRQWAASILVMVAAAWFFIRHKRRKSALDA